MKHYNVVKSICSLFISVALISSCSSVDASFPEFTVNSQPDLNEAETTEVSVNPSEDDVITVESVPHVTVALPYSEQTINFLGKLYYLKTSGTWDSSNSGGNISLDYLRSIKSPYIIDALLTSPVGANLTTVNYWNENQCVPDLFLSNDLRGMYDCGYIVPMDQYLYDNELLSSVFSTDVIYECSVDSNLYGIPYGFSFDLLYANLDFIPTSYIEQYAIESDSFINAFTDIKDLSSFLEMINADNETSEDEEKFSPPVPIRGAYMLLMNYCMRDDFERVADEIGIITDWYESGLAVDYDSNNSDPVFTRNAALWISDSSEIDRWCDYYPGKICFFRLPDIAGTYNPQVTLYPLCVSSQSGYKEFASDFAAFIALDEDAQLLIARLENNKGIYPMIDSISLWNNLTSDVEYGDIARSIQQQLHSLDYNLNVIDNEKYMKVLSESRNAVNSEEEEYGQ